MHLETIYCHINLAADHTCILGGQLFFEEQVDNHLTDIIMHIYSPLDIHYRTRKNMSDLSSSRLTVLVLRTSHVPFLKEPHTSIRK